MGEPAVRDAVVLPRLRGLGAHQRVCDLFPGRSRPDGPADGTARGGAGPAGLARAHPRRTPHRSIRRPGRLHRPLPLRGAAGLADAVGVDLSRLAPRGIFRGRGRLDVRGRHRVFRPLVSTGAAGDGAGHLRDGEHGALGGRVPRAGRRLLVVARRGVPCRGGTLRGLGRGVLPRGAQCAGDGEACDGRRDDSGADDGAAVVAARRLLFPDFRRLRRLLGVPADAAPRSVRTDDCRRGVPRCRLRRAGDADASRGRRPVGSPGRRAGPLRRLRRGASVRAPADVALDDSVHRRRAGLRGAARARQRRRVQAGAGALSRQHRNGDRPGRRARRTRRLLSAAAPRILQGALRRRMARLCAAGSDGGCAVGAECAHPPGPPADGRTRAPRHLVPLRAAAPRGRVGVDGHRVARGRHRRRLAQPGEFRSRPGDLHVRGGLRDLGHRLPLRDLARQTADATVLRAELRAASAAGARQERADSRRRVRDAPGGTDLHPEALAPALVDAPAPVLGLRDCGGDYVSAGLRLDPLPFGAGRSGTPT